MFDTFADLPVEDQAACLVGKRHLIRRANYWYGALIVWNLVIILAAPGRTI